MDHAVDGARAHEGDAVRMLMHVRDQVGHFHSRVAEAAPFPSRTEANGIVFHELACHFPKTRWELLSMQTVERGLWIKQFHLTRAADHEEKDAPLGTRREVRPCRPQFGVSGA